MPYYSKQVCLYLFLLVYLGAYDCSRNQHKIKKPPSRLSVQKEPESVLYQFQPSPTVHPIKVNPANKKPLVKNKITRKQNVNFDFECHIQKLREIADRKRGITWKLTGDTLLRDATKAHGNLYAGEDYMVMILSIYRAAKKLCMIQGKPKAGQLFEKKANAYMQNYLQATYSQRSEDFWFNEVKQMNQETVLLLQQHIFPQQDREGINENLRKAENYAGLDDPHYNVVTIVQVGSKRFALEDKKCLPLTAKQQSEFKNRHSVAWYQQLDPLEQKLLDAALPKFLDGAHYIPTQLRHIAGCRNAYQKSILAYDETGKETVLGRYYHTGTLASLVVDKAISEHIAKHNWEQVCTHAPNVDVMSLNHNVEMPIYGEKHIVEQTQRIVGDSAFLYMPINEFGTLTKPKFKPQVKDLLKEAATYYQAQYPDISQHLLEENLSPEKKERWTATIEAIQNKQDKVYFHRLCLLKEAAENSDYKNTFKQGLQRLGNYYADVGANYISCRTVLDQRKGRSNATILFSCKSGKDRTGFMSYLVDGHIIHTTHPTLDTVQCYKTLAKASHQQFLSSLNGGMPGRFGMKPVQQNEIARHIGVSKQLFPNAAQLTQIPLK